MPLKLLVLRPEPGNAATCASAAAMGLEAIPLPLFTIEAVPHPLPDPADFDALLVTSANGARHGTDVIAAFSALPIHVVGEATARAAEAAGARHMIMGGGDIARTLPGIMAAGHGRLLHLCGGDVRGFDPGDARVTRCIVYRAVARPEEGVAPALEAASPALALVHSPRAGARLAELVRPARRGAYAIAAISAAAAEAAGSGWMTLRHATRPTDEALLALARNLCDELH